MLSSSAGTHARYLRSALHHAIPRLRGWGDSIWPYSSEGRNKRWQQQWVVGWARVTGVTEVTYVLRLLLLL